MAACSLCLRCSPGQLLLFGRICAAFSCALRVIRAILKYDYIAAVSDSAELQPQLLSLLVSCRPLAER